jgi:hypothetical protein
MFPALANAAGDSDNPFATPEEKLAAAGPRTWSDASGKFKIEARLLRVEDGKVVLSRTDDKEVSVPIDKLSEADQKYVTDIAGAKSPAAVGSKPADKPADGAASALGDASGQAGGAKVGLISTDYRPAMLPDLPRDVEWTFRPTKAAGPDVLPSVRVPLPAVDSFDRLNSIYVLPKDKQAFVVYLNLSSPYVCKIQACNLQSSRAESSAVFAEGETPIDISPDGAMVVSQMQRSTSSSPAELRLYSREGNKVKPLKAWKPYVTPNSTDKSDNWAEVEWAVFTDSQHLLTLGRWGTLVVWEVPTLKPTWALQTSSHVAPPITVGEHKYLAIVEPSTRAALKTAAAGAKNPMAQTLIGREEERKGGIFIFDITDARAVASMPGEDILNGSSSRAAAALRGDGARFALWETHRVRIWDLQGRQIVRDFAIEDSTVGWPTNLSWAADDCLLLNGKIFVDVERRVPIATSSGSQSAATIIDGKAWFLEEGRSGKSLVGAPLPTKAMRDPVEKFKPEDLLVLRPGMEIALDIQIAADPAQVATLKDALENRLKSNGMKLVAECNNRLVVAARAGATRRIKYRPWHTSAGTEQEHDVATQTLSLGIQIGGETVWKDETSTAPPSTVQLQEMDTIDQAISRALKQQEDSILKYFTNTWIPAYIARIPGTANTEKLQPQPNPKPKAIGRNET